MINSFETKNYLLKPDIPMININVPGIIVILAPEWGEAESCYGSIKIS